MSVKYFLQEKWSAKIQETLDLKAELVAHCNRDYEGDCKYANTVRILGVGDPMVDGYHGTVSYESMDDSAQNLPIDIQEYFSFIVDDIDKAQSMPGLPEKYQEKAVKKLALRRELNVGRLVAGKCLSTEEEKKATYELSHDESVIPYKDYYYQAQEKGATIYKRVKKPVQESLSSYYEITSATYKEGAENVTTATGKTQANIKTAIDDALVNLRVRNVAEDGYIEIDPRTYNSFKNNLVELSTNNPEMIRKGVVGMYDDFTVTRTNAIFNDGTHHYCYAHTGNAIAFAGQINEVESLRLEGTFGDGVRGLDTYGMKIIDQDQIELIKVPV